MALALFFMLPASVSGHKTDVSPVTYRQAALAFGEVCQGVELLAPLAASKKKSSCASSFS